MINGDKMSSRETFAFWCALVPILLVILYALSALVFGFVWNFIAPTFNAPTFDFYQSLAVVFLIWFIGSASKVVR